MVSMGQRGRGVNAPEDAPSAANRVLERRMAYVFDFLTLGRRAL